MSPEEPATPVGNTRTEPGPARSGKSEEHDHALWVRLLMPSLADVIFLIAVYALLFGALQGSLLTDADIGWHIRNGEYILASHSVPRVDDFSVTMHGQPWYAWEWLFDVVAGWLHSHLGLNGIVLLGAVIIGLAAAALFRVLLARGANLVVALVLTIMMLATSRVHMLARPHLFTWLFVLLWVHVLYRYAEGNKSIIWWLPLSMVAWVNLHGGFIVGLGLLTLFAVASIVTRWLTGEPSQPGLSRRFAAVAMLSLAATFVNPYGYKLHLHVYKYLTSSFLMDVVQEFQSPDFHHGSGRWFEALLLLTLLGLCLAGRRLRTFDFLLMSSGVYLGLAAVRNLPLACIFLAVAIAPALTAAIAELAADSRAPARLREACAALVDISSGTRKMESLFRAHALPLLVILGLAGIALNGGRLGSHWLLDAHFDERVLPVKATAFMAGSNISVPVLSPDHWAGYLIYKLYPSTRVVVDDRHDLYGEAFMKEFAQFARGYDGMEAFLRKYQVSCVLMPNNSVVAKALQADPGWEVRYRDDTAVLLTAKSATFSRP